MKTLSLALLLMASMAFVLLGCSENSTPVVAPADQAGSSISSASLAKHGPIVCSVHGSGTTKLEGKTAVFVVHAFKYADGTVDGEYEVNNTSFRNLYPEGFFKWHGKVKFLKVYNGNTAIIGGQQTSGTFEGLYDIYLAIDMGEGSKAPSDSTNYNLALTPDYSAIWEIWNKPLEYLEFNIFAPVLPVDAGNFQVYSAE